VIAAYLKRLASKPAAGHRSRVPTPPASARSKASTPDVGQPEIVASTELRRMPTSRVPDPFEDPHRRMSKADRDYLEWRMQLEAARTVAKQAGPFEPFCATCQDTTCIGKECPI
jgi:hypothetical protein